MKKSTLIIIVTVFILVAIIVPTVFAEGGFEAITNAETKEAMELAIRETSDMTDEVALLDGLEDDKRASVMGSVFRRRGAVEDMAELKAMFEKQFNRYTETMSWVEGYPYLSDVSTNGAILNVLTDKSGWVYIVAIPDNITGGVGSAYSMMKLYDEDNGVYKKKVWVQAGIPKQIPISCGTYGSGATYRSFVCLSVRGNETGFMQLDYTIDKVTTAPTPTLAPSPSPSFIPEA